MAITSAIVLFMVIWALIFFMVLPWGVVSQQESGEIVPGTPASAPTDAQIKRKVLITTGIAAVVWLAAFLAITYRVFSIDDIPFLTPPSMR